MDLKRIVDLLCQTTKSKEEAFLRGLLFGYGAHRACPIPNWELMKKAPEIFVKIEKEMREIFEEIHEKEINAAVELLKELQNKNSVK